MEEVAIKIKQLIADLHVFGYKVHIDNYCIGDFHNISIRKYVVMENRFIRFFFHYDLYKLEFVNHYQFRLPSDGDKVIEILNDLLNKELE